MLFPVLANGSYLTSLAPMVRGLSGFAVALEPENHAMVTVGHLLVTYHYTPQVYTRWCFQIIRPGCLPNGWLKFIRFIWNDHCNQQIQTGPRSQPGQMSEVDFSSNFMFEVYSSHSRTRLLCGGGIPIHAMEFTESEYRPRNNIFHLARHKVPHIHSLGRLLFSRNMVLASNQGEWRVTRAPCETWAQLLLRDTEESAVCPQQGSFCTWVAFL